jgi:hypothetical protein
MGVPCTSGTNTALDDFAAHIIFLTPGPGATICRCISVEDLETSGSRLF